jgi:hypothetical protein
MSPEEEIEKIIGRKLPHEERGRVSDLNEFPNDILLEARSIAKISRILACILVRFYTERSQFDEVQGFTEDVIVGGQDPAFWRREPRLCRPIVDDSRVIGLDRNKVVSLLQNVPGERWVRRVPQRAHWNYTGYCGAPAVLNRTANYRWRSPEGVSALMLTGGEAIESIDDLAVGVRRWIASRVAWQLARKQIELTPSTSAHEVACMLSEDTSLSPDAEIAISGLLREERELGPSSDAVPGFRGPDEWYAA